MCTDAEEAETRTSAFPWLAAFSLKLDENTISKVRIRANYSQQNTNGTTEQKAMQASVEWYGIGWLE